MSQLNVVLDVSRGKMMSSQHARLRLRPIPSPAVTRNKHALHRDNPLGGRGAAKVDARHLGGRSVAEARSSGVAAAPGVAGPRLAKR
jgi:hypothetical protein